MFGLLGILDSISPERRAKRTEFEAAELERRIEQDLQDFSEDIQYQKYLTIRASTYKQPSLFQVNPTDIVNAVQSIPKDQRVLSPGGSWMYSEVILPRGRKLNCAYGKTIGNIVFDGEVLIPRIHRMREVEWDSGPWMSLTPLELFTLRAGARFAKGTTILAGLGMGHQLEKVCQKKSVKKVILVEREEELIQWILPRLNLHGRDLEVIIGDAYQEIPKLTADAALIDIYKTYGHNTFVHCPNIKKIWVWGSAKIPDSGF